MVTLDQRVEAAMLLASYRNSYYLQRTRKKIGEGLLYFSESLFGCAVVGRLGGIT